MVAYDITDDARRERVAAALQDYGVRVQKSIFECSITAAERRVMVGAVRSRIDPAVDSVLVYGVCTRCLRRVLRLGPPPPDPGAQFRLL
ncbi:MAG: CRISPR-associated protein Cas2 [Gemmatimonadetes bacterium]|nr:CRISPR-associated protein Cas2 [Gemmatimonadota bacterium]